MSVTEPMLSAEDFRRLLTNAVETGIEWACDERPREHIETHRLHEVAVAAVVKAHADALSELERMRGALAALQHSEALIQADLQGFATDASTPTFQLVRNLLADRDELEKSLMDEQAAPAPAAVREPAWVKCEECHGTGRTDNHVTGEIECGACEGTGAEPPPATVREPNTHE